MYPTKYYVCIIWRTSVENENRLKKLIEDSNFFEIVFENRMYLPKENTNVVLTRMYDYFVPRPWEKQIAALQDTNYYFLLIKSKLHEVEDWIITRGGIVKGSKKLLELKENYRQKEGDNWLSLHTSINQDEMLVDLYTHTGIIIQDNIENPNKLFSPPVPGIYQNYHEFLNMLSVYKKYCLFFNTAESYLNSNKKNLPDKSITLLVDNKKSFENFSGMQSNLVKIGDSTLRINLLDTNTRLLSPSWVYDILSSCRTDKNNIKTPSPINRLFTMIYFLNSFDRNSTDKKLETIKNICRQENLFKENNLDSLDMEFWQSRLKYYLMKSSFFTLKTKT